MNHQISAVYLTDLAKEAMLERHLLPDFPQQVQQEVQDLLGPAIPISPIVRDLRNNLWFSIDNDDTKDLDQLTYAEELENGRTKVLIAIADVDSLVKQGTATDAYAQQNTTSVYTPTKIFSMLPERLSTDLTSLNEKEDRMALIAETIIESDGSIQKYDFYPAFVRNQAKLAYNSVANWLDGKASIPTKIAQTPALEKQVRLQDQIAQKLRQSRHQQGALTLDTLEARTIVDGQQIVEIKPMTKNRARELIEDLMIAANIASARFLKDRQLPAIRRVVRTPKRWDRIIEIAKSYGETLPSNPDAKALDLFLIKRRLTDPLHFPDLSLTIVKLLGRGEYILEKPDQEIGHFSLAVKSYTHSTAPNRRYIDLINQRLVKAILANQPLPYKESELDFLAAHCTQKEDDADKVERKMRKMAAIFFLSSKLNQTFDALVTGASAKGTWVRIFNPPTEGKLIEGYQNIDVGDRIKVKLVHVDLEKGFIDFIKL